MTDVDVVLEFERIDLGSGELLVDGGTWWIELGEPGWLDVDERDVVIDEAHEDQAPLCGRVGRWVLAAGVPGPGPPAVVRPVGRSRVELERRRLRLSSASAQAGGGPMGVML